MVLSTQLIRSRAQAALPYEGVVGALHRRVRKRCLIRSLRLFFSTDETVSLLKSFPNTRLFQRAFDSQAQQWNYAVKDTAVSTEWVLALDADYYLTDQFIQEVSQLTPTHEIDGYTAAFLAECVLALRLIEQRTRSSADQDSG
jgi:hypothetical protein